MRVTDIIRKKRDGEDINKEELTFLIKGALSKEVPDYQVSAFLMAAYLRGLNNDETISLADVMLHSGEILDLSEIENPIVDKHSTGGVGDKVSIVLAPLLSAAGVVVPMISGRGLGYTGGTLDKLESIPGFRTDMRLIDFRNILLETGVAMVGQTDEIVPADKKLYALRDVTATVESIPLIASSIMSKKLAEGLDGLVLDVKVGSGTFIKTMEDAELLAEKMISIGNYHGVKTVAVITDMDEPLGKAVGNALEIRECINILKGKAEADLLEVILMLGAWMLYIAEEMVKYSEEKKYVDMKAGVNEGKLAEKKINLEGVINSGKALERFAELIEIQGGNPEIIATPGLLPVAQNIKPISSPAKGYINRVNAEKAGIASMLLGAGRQRIDDEIDQATGVTFNKRRGATVEKGDTLAVLHYNDEKNINEATELIENAFEIGNEPEPRKMIKKIIL